MSCISAHDPQLERLAHAIAQRVGQQRFSVWFNNSTRLDLKHDSLEIAVPNDFISEWIGRNFSGPIQDAAHEVLGCDLLVKFSVMPQLFDGKRPGAADSPIRGLESMEGTRPPMNGEPTQRVNGAGREAAAGSRPGRSELAFYRAEPAPLAAYPAITTGQAPAAYRPQPSAAILNGSAGEDGSAWSWSSTRSTARLRHDLSNFVAGSGNQLAYNAALHVAEFPGAQYNPLFIHGACGLGKTHLLQGLCKLFARHHPSRRWLYLTGEDFTNDFLTALRKNKVDVFRRKVRELDLLVIDDVHFLGGKKATQEEFLHTFNAIEALGRQVVMASDHHPKMIHEFGESLVNRFVSGMVVRIDAPNLATRSEILRRLAARAGFEIAEEVVQWVARRVTQNVRELEGAITRIGAVVRLTGQKADMESVQQALGDLERNMVAPVKVENIFAAVCGYFGIEERDLMCSRRQRTLSLARGVAMHLVRKLVKLSFPEIGMRMGRRNHSTVISACKRIERAAAGNERVSWLSTVGERQEEASELVQRLEELSRSLA